MKKISVRALAAVILALAVANALAASASIGIATARGTFRVDDANVSGNATLFEGTSVETSVSTGELSLGKTRVALSTETRGRVFQDYVVLEHGKIQWSGGAGFHAVVGEIQVAGNDGLSRALVSRSGARIEVGSLSGVVNVLNAGGQLLMTVPVGNAYAFDADPQGANPSNKPPSDSTKTSKTNAGKVGKAGLTTGTKILVGGLVATAIAVPATVVATRGSSTASK